MKDIKTIFWDWNGTLINDLDKCVELINKCLDRRGIKQVSHEMYLEEFEFPVKKYYEKIGFNFSTESFEKIGKEFIEDYERHMFECILHSDANHTLMSVKKTGIKQYILSAFNNNALKACIENYSLGEYFERIEGLDNIYAASKAELGCRLLKESGCSAESAMMVGDTIHDYETASAMGIRCVLIASGHNSYRRLESCGVPVYNTLADFLKYEL